MYGEGREVAEGRYPLSLANTPALSVYQHPEYVQASLFLQAMPLLYSLHSAAGGQGQD